ncbi:VOC family protein [Companilactobacillus sp. RD055328]|uniref:SMU1112c/YaeR family gloxylase I-like metalloprotein n=1 Tax=Companilactobacillus sp. RD055328 TaxID=2916634 RepID=UPI001FC8D1F0|nr:VOC family protein [Companilactobacillus sp. RD055328]GKQ42960.1 VOC family protein [Companilactobacillus sp. RD055328]
MKPNFSAIHHIAIIANNYDTARHFYVDILGLKIIRENNRSDKGDIKLDLQLNADTEIELFIKPDAPNRTSNPEALGLRHLALKTTNIEADIDYLINQGVKVEPLRVDDFTGKKMVFFWDPNNLPIELHE